MLMHNTTLEVSTQVKEKLMKFLDELNEVQKLVFIQYYLTDEVKGIIVEEIINEEYRKELGLTQKEQR